ncbi:MAG: AzlD domain-containing protein [Chloroflexi bacterium]|nr:AzlD domain-containing protein [Chloroflexota bacterium]MBI5350789.1 AzlD domain-containing protein [Chloroflexota bacterium]MBI5715194.1 AzlD domain-containing protein [Chloroflexota bacterium]
MSSTYMWFTILSMGVVTFLIRLSFIIAWGKFEMPPLVRRSLRYVPPAVLSAIILPELLRPNSLPIDFSLGNARWIAGLVAALIAWRTRNALLTILIGMIVFWIISLVVK